MSNNIISIILILLVIGIIVYFYYNYKNKENVLVDNSISTSQNFPTTKSLLNKNYRKNREKKLSGKKMADKKSAKTKRVRFNDRVKYNIYRDKSCSSSIDVDSICSLDNQDNEKDLAVDDNGIDNLPICPSNMEVDNDTWDAHFGLPLMDDKSKKKFAQQMKHEHEKYNQSLGKFHQYQTDDSTLIKTDTTIDPFKPEDKSQLKGVAIQDIYDDQVKGPKAKPKKIMCKTATNTVYENESELNGGTINGTSMCGYDGANDGYQSANFGNEF